MPANSDLVDKGVTAGRPFSDEHAAKALLSSAFAGNRPPRIGEVVTVIRRGVRHDLVVVGVVTEATLSTIIVPRGTAQRIFNLDGKLSGAYVRYGTALQRSKAEREAPPAATGPAQAKPVSTAEVLERTDIDEATASASPPASRAPPCRKSGRASHATRSSSFRRRARHERPGPDRVRPSDARLPGGLQHHRGPVRRPRGRARVPLLARRARLPARRARPNTRRSVRWATGAPRSPASHRPHRGRRARDGGSFFSLGTRRSAGRRRPSPSASATSRSTARTTPSAATTVATRACT